MSAYSHSLYDKKRIRCLPSCSRKIFTLVKVPDITLALGLNTENLVKRALFAIATHSNQDELTAAERKFAAAFENAYQASLESNDTAESDPTSTNKELERHRRWGWIKKAVKKTTKWVKKAAKKVKKAAKKTVK